MRISRYLLPVTILAFLFTLTIAPATAGSMGNGAAQRMRLVVTSVDTKSGAVELKSLVDQAVHTYKINAATIITVGRAKGTIDQIKAGQKVLNFAVQGGQLPTDGQTLTLLWLMQASPTTAAPANP